ncbi:MAG: glycoside hydrolase family 99-like domain-containing protein [Bacteroidaceae bacterium]|nr:glycoside hydrolase family 99-like domain-containing protein [Bacteroidaceae bacterium]
MNKPRLLALYLPQFHPIPENDEHWGRGFTEWTNVAKAKPLFRGHYQPKVPADLGFYDLRMEEVRISQAELAKEAGIEGFCYWHYWFGNGKRLLERPFNEVVASGKPDFPFCLCWANHSWSNKTWKKDLSIKVGNMKIAEQLYPGREDYESHFYEVLPAFKDKRYVQVDGKPVFFVFDANVPQMKEFIEVWRELAVKNGLKGIHFVAMLYTASLRSNLSVTERIDNVLKLGFDAINTIGNTKAEIECGKIKRYINALFNKIFHIGVTTKYNQEEINKHMFSEEDKLEYVYPTIMPNWDRSPRAGKDCTIYINSTPLVFQKHVEDALNIVGHKQPEHQIITIRSWNEWGEGNYLEPCLKYGHGYLDAIKKVLKLQ